MYLVILLLNRFLSKGHLLNIHLDLFRQKISQLLPDAMLSCKLSREFSWLISIVDNDILVLSIAYLDSYGQHLFGVGRKTLAKRGGLIRLAQVMVQVVILRLVSCKLAFVL